MKKNSRILYRVTAKYKGKNQIPTGVLIEAQSEDGNFKLCKFCYNIQKNVLFDYSDGTIIKDNRNPISKLVHKIRKYNRKKVRKSKRQNENFIINRQNNTFHKVNECDMLKNVESKYINEVTAKMEDLLIAKLKP